MAHRARRLRRPCLSLLSVGAATALGVTSALAGASSPLAAVDGLVDAIEQGDKSAIETLVCEGQRGAALARFDVGTAFGIADDAVLAGSVGFGLASRSAELVAERADTAIVHLSAELTVEYDEAQAREVVRAMLEAEGDTTSEADLDFMVPLMLSAFDEGQAIDADLEVILEDGGWVVCGGLMPEDPSLLEEPTVSFGGLCGIVSLEDINSASSPGLQYDSSDGFEDICMYSTSSIEDYHSLTLWLDAGETLDTYRSLYPDGSAVTIAGWPAWAAFDQLLIEAPAGVLQLSVYPGEEPPVGFDTIRHLTSIAEAVAPRLDELESESLELTPLEAGSGDIGQASLCPSVDVAALNASTGLAFDDMWDGGEICIVSRSSPEEGLPTLTLYRDPAGFEDLEVFFPDGDRTSVAGRPAYSAAGQLWVETEDGVIGIEVSLDDVPAAEGVDQLDLAVRIAEVIVATLPAES